VHINRYSYLYIKGDKIMRLVEYIDNDVMTCEKFLTKLVEAKFVGSDPEMAKKYRGVPIADIPIEDLWSTMSQGNAKLSKKIKIFNLPAGKSCPDASICYKNCYAKKAEGIYPGVRAARERNFRMAKENSDLLKKQILAKLVDGDIVRIHESGDMFSQEYLDMWTEIVKARPNTIFYAYSKTLGRWDWSKIKSLPNFNVVGSIIGGLRNFGPEEEVKLRAQELNIPLCPCKKGNKVVCGVDCTICQTEPEVLFIQH
jgi:hypothetical protein